MYHYIRTRNRIMGLAKAFKKDGYEIKKIVNKFNRLGIVAEHRTAINYDTGQKKKVYYLEGTNYEMGYLLGLLAEKEIAAMTIDFAEKVVFSFIGSKVLVKIKLIREALINVIYSITKTIYQELPTEIRDEIRGIFDGCRKFNPNSNVDIERLIVLNAGFDALCSRLYTGNILSREIPGIKPWDLNIPIMCNAFAVFGNTAAGSHYFGRDFMFPTAGVFQNTASMIIYNPVGKSGRRAFPFVSVTAPGMVGSISAMNINMVGIGVDMAPAANCDTERVGTNSLLLARMCAQYGQSADHAVEIMIKSHRGVSWNYIVSDGARDRACVVEAGKSGDNQALLEYPPEDLVPVLPDIDFISKHKTVNSQNGLMVRWNDYKYPEEYLKYNYELWKKYSGNYRANKVLYDDAHSQYGYFNRTHTERNCPSSYYFTPQREESNSIVIATNHFIIPEMRFYAMHPWISGIVQSKIDDIQWRYDELNHQILTALDQKGSIAFETARQLIDYLAPYGKFPSYYENNPRSSDGKEIRIEGCTSVFDLKNLIVESHYGYYCDDWVRLTLSEYIL